MKGSKGEGKSAFKIVQANRIQDKENIKVKKKNDFNSSFLNVEQTTKPTGLLKSFVNPVH